jgi:hypothetical protein
MRLKLNTDAVIDKIYNMKINCNQICKDKDYLKLYITIYSKKNGIWEDETKNGISNCERE